MTQPAPAPAVEHPEVSAAKARVAALADASAKEYAAAATSPLVPQAAELGYAAERAVIMATTPSPSLPEWAALGTDAKAVYQRKATLALLGYTSQAFLAAMTSPGSPVPPAHRAQKKGEPGAEVDGFTASKEGRMAGVFIEACRAFYDASKVPNAQVSIKDALDALARTDVIGEAKRPHADGFKASPEQIAVAKAKLEAGDSDGARAALSTDEPPWPMCVPRYVIHAVRGDLHEAGHNPGPRKSVGVAPSSNVAPKS